MRHEPKFRPKTRAMIYNAKDDPEQRLEALEAHHIEETTELMAEIDRLRGIINAHVEDEKDKTERQGYPW